MERKKVKRGGRELVVERPFFSHYVFIRTERHIETICNEVFYLRYPLRDRLNYTPVLVPDNQLQIFLRALASEEVTPVLLDDPFEKFKDHPMVRVTEGPCEGMEGRLVRIKRNRRIVINMAGKSITLEGVDYNILEIIEE